MHADKMHSKSNNKCHVMLQCRSDDLSDDWDVYRPYTPIKCNTQGRRKRASCSTHVLPGLWVYEFGEFGKIEQQCIAQQFLPMKTLGFALPVALDKSKKSWDKNPKHPNSPWILIILFTILSEIAHTLIAQETQRRQELHATRRVTLGSNVVRGGFWGFLFRVLLCLWLGWFSGALGFRCVLLNSGFTRLRKPCRHKTKYSKKLENRVEKFDVEVDVMCHGVGTPLHTNRIVGDGNCYWRAVAKQTNMSWYKLKARTIASMMQHAQQKQDEELCRNIKLLRKKNAWANILAILGTAAYLQCEVRVCVNGHIIKCCPQHINKRAKPKHRHNNRVISLHFANSHYSGVDAAEVRHRLAIADSRWSSSLKEFLNNPLDAYAKDVVVSRHRINTARIANPLGNQNDKRRIVQVRAARFGRVDSMPPQYRPAGPGLPTRRPHEDFASQVLRIAKAKVSAPAAGIPLAHPVPKVPPQPPAPPPRRATERLMTMTTKAPPTPVIRTPTEPPYPPPGRTMTNIPQPKTPPKAPMTPPKPPPRPRRTSTWSTSSSTNDALTSSSMPETNPPGPSTRPEIITAAAPETRMPFHRLIKKPRTPPAPRRNMPSTAPPAVELPPAVEDNSDISGGECAEDDTIQQAPLEILVNRVVDEVSRRVLESLAHAPYMVGTFKASATRMWMRFKLQRSLPAPTCWWNTNKTRTFSMFHLNLTNQQLRMQERDGPDFPAAVPTAKVSTHSGFKVLGLGLGGVVCVKNRVSCIGHSTSYKDDTHTKSNTSNAHNDLLRTVVDDSGDEQLAFCIEEGPAYGWVSPLWYYFQNRANEYSYRNTVMAKHEGLRASDNCGLKRSCSACGQQPIPSRTSHFLYIRGLRLINLISGSFHSGIPSSDCCTQLIASKQACAKSAKTNCQRKSCNAHPRSGDREQHDASADGNKQRYTSSFAAAGLFCRWFVACTMMLPVLNNGVLIPIIRALQGGMMSHDISLEDCARNILVGDSISVESIRTLLDHPEAPWALNGTGHQITLGAARLTLTKASNKFPNFTQVITAYMKQCNRSAYGTTIVINKNLKTEVHTDSRNEKLPAYLTAITNYGGGEIFLQSEHGNERFDKHKGFLIPIPIGNTISVPTFKIPHATNSWVGNRIIAVLFSCPLKRLAASRNNLKSKLQRLGFHIPEINRSWIDCEITGNSNGNPIYSKPAPIRGFFPAGDRQHHSPSDGVVTKFGTSECEVWEVSSCSEIEPESDLTRTWSNLLDLQISDIECCPEDVPSPATTELDTDSELHNFVHDETTIVAPCRKRKNMSPTRMSGQEREASDSRRLSIYKDSPVGFGEHSFLRWDSEISGDGCYSPPKSSSERQCDVDLNAHCSNEVSMIDDDGRWACRSSRSDPIEDCTDDENNCFMCGGGAPAVEFQPNKADISKLVQKLKNVPHGFAPKQIRMLLISDAKFYRKIERTADVKQLQDCVAAAAKRMGLNDARNENQIQTPSSSTAGSKWKLPDMKPSLKKDGTATSGKGGLTAFQKGKGKGDIQTNEQKGKGKGKNGKDINIHKHDVENAGTKSKAKGKGKHNNVTYSIDPDGWNVRPLTEFANTHGGIYMCEKEEQAKHIAEKGVGKNYPIGVLAPFPMDIGVKQPESICVEFVKHFGDQSQKISMQAFLHQITYVDVEYRKMAPAVSIQKPSIAKTSVCYLTFSDSGACAQTRIEIEQKRLPAVKQWISSLVQHNRGLEILDVWNVQAIQQHVNERGYQASVRVPSAQVESLLAMSSPGKLQVNVPGALRTNLQHIWLKKEGRPMTEKEVLDVMEEHKGKHLGAFQVRGTWALRMLTENHSEMKTKLGKNEDPAYFISNVPPDMETENIQDILQQLKWKATVKDGERRWKQAGYTWMVRSSEDPKVWQFPVTFGYERRTLKIEAARKPKTMPAPPAPANSVIQFPTWNAQCRIGKHQPRTQQLQPTFADIVNNAARKRHRPEVEQIPQEDSENWSDFEDDAVKQEDKSLQQQLQDMMKQNSEQQQTIQQLMQQVQNLTAQIQALTAQNLTGGAVANTGTMLNPGNTS